MFRIGAGFLDDCFKASPLLRAWLTRLEQLGVRLHNRHRWTGWDDSGALRFEAAGGQEVSQQASATVLGLGGATWPRLGSTGAWKPLQMRAQTSAVEMPEGAPPSSASPARTPPFAIDDATSRQAAMRAPETVRAANGSASVRARGENSPSSASATPRRGRRKYDSRAAGCS